MRPIRFLLAAAALGSLAGPAGAVSSIPSDEALDCPPVCSTTCVKPLVVPDRWDDVTPLAGHAAWSRNGRYDRESFTDVNENGLYDAGEVYDDTNGNGRCDEEAYHPALTGYIPDPYPGNVFAGPEGDRGRLLQLTASKESAVVAGNYLAVSFPPIGKGEPGRGARAFRNALERCVPYPIQLGDEVELEPGNMAGPAFEGLRAMYELDPNARWDPATRTIVDSAFDPLQQPRLVFVAFHDPRSGPAGGRASVRINKIAAFFFEAPSAGGTVNGRFLKVRSPGSPCSCSCDQATSFLRDCP